MSSQRFSKPKNTGNGVLEGEIGNIFYAGKGAWLRTPLRDHTKGIGPSLAFHTNGEGYVNSIQPPFKKFLDPPLPLITLPSYVISTLENLASKGNVSSIGKLK